MLIDVTSGETSRRTSAMFQSRQMHAPRGNLSPSNLTHVGEENMKITLDTDVLMSSMQRQLARRRLRIGMGVLFTLGPLLVYAASITKPNTFTDGAVISAAQVNANFDTVYSGVNAVDTRVTGLEAKANWCYSCNATGSSTTSTTWTDMTGWGDCTITTTGRPVFFNAEYSLYIAANHSGMRVVMDPGTSGQKIFGTEGTYGLDWQSHFPGTWIKRSMTRVFSGIPAGTHKFRMQFRSQSAGNLTQVHSGDCNNDVLYSGSHMFMQELK